MPLFKTLQRMRSPSKIRSVRVDTPSNLSSPNVIRAIPSPNVLIEPVKSISCRALIMHFSSSRKRFQNSWPWVWIMKSDAGDRLHLSPQVTSKRLLDSLRFCINSGSFLSLSTGITNPHFCLQQDFCPKSGAPYLPRALSDDSDSLLPNHP